MTIRDWQRAEERQALLYMRELLSGAHFTKSDKESRERLIEQASWTGVGFASPTVRRDLHEVGEALQIGKTDM